MEAWLRDEATANIYWLYSNAIGGVKVEVFEEDIERAREILDLPKEESGLLTLAALLHFRFESALQ